MNTSIAFIPAGSVVLPRLDATAAAQELTGAMIQIGAAVESIRYANLAREMLNLSVSGRMTEPTVRQLK